MRLKADWETMSFDTPFDTTFGLPKACLSNKFIRRNIRVCVILQIWKDKTNRFTGQPEPIN